MSQLRQRRNAVNSPKVSGRVSVFEDRRKRSYDGYSRSRKTARYKDMGIPSFDDYWHTDESDQKDQGQHGLTSIQVEAFQEVFNLFDINGGGTIDATELDSALRTVDIQLTRTEIVDVLQVIDEDGNGEIDFEEFLTMMTSTEKFLENLRGGSKEQGKENVLFSALAKFMKKSALSSLSEIERYYNSKVRKSPHVVGHYAAGARLIGLTEKQMAKHLATLSSVNEGENNNSPYAQPLCMFQSDITPTKLLPKRKGNGKIRLRIITNKPLPSEGEDGADREMAPDGSGTANGAEGLTNADQVASVQNSHPVSKPKLCRPKAPMRLRPTTVPLPAVSIAGIQRKNQNALTIEDLPQIRSKVQMANEFYRKRQNTVRMGVSQSCAFTDLSVIKSKALQKQFKSILEAYSFKPMNVPSSLTINTDSFLQPFLFTRI